MSKRRRNLHFFHRESDGTVRLRIRFEGEVASMFEEAAGQTPIMTWIFETLTEAAEKQVAERRSKQHVAPPH